MENTNSNSTYEIMINCSGYTWDNGTNFLHHKKDTNTHATYKAPKLLPPCFQILIKFVKLQSSSHITLGVTDKIINENGTKYLGGEYGPGNWGISGTGTVGQGGSWASATCNYKQGDIITFFGKNGVITFAVNGVLNTSYSYHVGSDKLYLAVTLYYKDDCLEIVEETL
jgi:hypothetical protein